MCGRFRLQAPREELRRLFALRPEEDLVPEAFPPGDRFPGQEVVALCADPKRRRLGLLRWGLVPSWAKDPSVGKRLFNARIETVAERAAFREAYRHRRCLIPANAFYEWEDRGTRPRRPWLFRSATGGLLVFAGLWERWRDPRGATLSTCTILTRVAGAVVSPIHSRMPLILGPELHRPWLEGSLSLTEPETSPCDLRAEPLAPPPPAPGRTADSPG